MKPVQMGQAAIEVQGQALALEAVEPAAAEKGPGTEGMAALHQHLPQNEDEQRRLPARHPATELAQGAFNARGRAFYVAALESQLPQLAFDLGMGQGVLRQVES